MKELFSPSTWLHLRIPFSYFLLPVFLFAFAVSPNFYGGQAIWSFVIIHFLLYPASNGFNSYFDKDEKSIGGLKNPPPVNKGLYYISLLFDIAAVLLGWINVNVLFAMMLFIYGMVSKAYSHPSIRLKKYAITGWITAGFFQGFFTFLMCYSGINDFGITPLLSGNALVPATLAMVMLLGNYPMTQIYQHDEDARRGDRTLSLLLGIRGTFVFVLIVFGLASAGFGLYFLSHDSVGYAYSFLVALAPVVLYFLLWMMRVWKNDSAADYKRTMWLNFLSATCLNAFFVYLFLTNANFMERLL